LNSEVLPQICRYKQSGNIVTCRVVRVTK
jgi:hypothetical protein